MDLLSLFGLVINTVVLLGAIGAAVALILAQNEAVSEIQKAASVIPMANETVQYSEVPMAVVCVIANHVNIPLQDVAAEYVKDAESRRALILSNFRKDPLSDYFISRFPSKFISHGYVGEELLIQ